MLKIIKDFFKKLFRIYKQKLIEKPKDIVESIDNTNIQRENSFKSSIAINNEEEKRALKLQKEFRTGLINEKDLSEEEYMLLTKLYKDQIEKTKQSIEKYKNRLIYLKSKLLQSN